MAKSAELKIPEDIEYRVIGNAFGLLIASAGLLAGEMVRLNSFDYWQNDIVPLSLLVWMGFGLFRNFLSTMNAYHDLPPQVQRPASASSQLQNQVAVGHIPAKPVYSPDKVVDEVAKRIEAKRAEALKKNKFTN